MYSIIKYRIYKWLKGPIFIIEGIVETITFGFGFTDLDLWILRKILKYKYEIKTKNKNSL